MDSVSINNEMDDFRARRVLVFGLGLLGGGVATANWFLERGAIVTVTDLKGEKELGSSIDQIRGQVTLSLGGHREEDIRESEVIVVNPGVPFDSPFIKLAKALGKSVESEATLFYRLCRQPIVAITGTRGKTTTTQWTRHLLDKRYRAFAAGNSPTAPLLEVLGQTSRTTTENESLPEIVVNELPSYHLELFDGIRRAPRIAMITNLYQDHLNRYGAIELYAKTKAQIFSNQTKQDDLILNYDNQWTNFFLKRQPRSHVWFFSTSELPTGASGVFCDNTYLYFKQSQREAVRVFRIADFVVARGRHGVENLMASSLAAHLCGISWNEIESNLESLPEIPFRQQTIHETESMKIINDTTATTPEGALAAVKRFGGPACVLIAGGTDANLDYEEWGKVLFRYIRPENLVLLTGSATNKMIAAFGHLGDGVTVRSTLQECVRIGLEKAAKYENSILLFSPGAKSFESFLNEMDRGREFNKLLEEAQLWRTQSMKPTD